MKLKKTHFKQALLSALCLLLAFSTYAGPLTVNITNSTGGALPGAKYKLNKGPNYVGEYSPGDPVTLIDGASYTIFAHYDGTSTSRTTFTALPAGNTFNYNTTNVKFHFSGSYLNFRTSGSWSGFGKTGGVWNARELFPKDYIGNTMQIQTAHVWNDRREIIFTIDYEGMTSVVKTIAVIRVLNSSDNPIAGVTARGGTVTPTTWHVPGSTNANGLLVDLRNGNQTSLAYEAKVNNTTAVVGPQDPNTNSYYLFKTNLLSLQLLTCGNSPLSGGTARYGNGANFSTWFFPAPNSTDANGITSAELFPGTYSFEMNYQSTSQVKSSVVIPNANTTLTWNTTNVTLNWPYAISYGGSGDSRFFNKPSMELLPGTYNFNFRAPGSNNYTPLTIAGCSMNLTPGLVQLRSSTNAALAGGIVEGYQGGWATYGSTGANGNLLVLGPKPSSVRVTLGGGSQQLNGINFTSNPIVNFQTKLVTMEFKASDNSPLNSTALGYYAGGWKTFGSGSTTNGSASMEMMPATYSFRLGYAGAVQSVLNQNINSNPLVSFQTVNAIVKLKDGSNAPIAGGIASYYASGWNSFGTTDVNGIAEKELLPVPYSFRMQYSAKTKQLDGVTPVNATPIEFTFESGNFARVANSEASDNVMDEFRTSIYPNPAVSSINISLPEGAGAAEVKIITLDGRLVLNKVLEINNRSVNVAELPAGIYQVNLNYDGKSQMHRLIVTR